MTLSGTNILCSFLLLLLLLKNVESQINTVFTITHFREAFSSLIYERDAMVPPSQFFLRLTPRLYTTGRVVYREPVTLWQSYRQLSFTTTITMQMTRLGANPLGEGMTFFMVPVGSTERTGGDLDNLGIYDAVIPGSPVFAVEFDLACGELDPEYPHIGININSIRSQRVGRFENATGRVVTARITYYVPTRRISVFATYGGTFASVSYVFNLAALLPARVNVGLSASTSDLAALFEVLTWRFNSTMGPDLNTITTKKNDTYIKQYV